VTELFSIVSKMELTIVDESNVRKGALIQEFCGQVVASGIVIDPDEMTPCECYQIVNSQCKSKKQMYTFMRLLFANSKLDLATK